MAGKTIDASMKINSITTPEFAYTTIEHDGESLSDRKLFFQTDIDTEAIVYTMQGDEHIFSMPFLFSGSFEDNEEDAGKQFFVLRVVYKVSLTLSGIKKITKEKRNEIEKISLPLLLDPYFRQTVAQSLMQAGLPTLLLPIPGVEIDNH